MESARPAAAERRREEREAAARRRRTSLRLGTTGVVLLFAAGIGFRLSPADGAALLGVMVAGIALIAAAFFLVRTPMSDLLRVPEE